MTFFIWYKNSFLATVVSIFGCGMICLGLPGLLGQVKDMLPASAVIIIAVGGVLVWLGSKISDRKAAKKAAGKVVSLTDYRSHHSWR